MNPTLLDAILLPPGCDAHGTATPIADALTAIAVTAGAVIAAAIITAVFARR